MKIIGFTNGALLDICNIQSISTISEKSGCYVIRFHNGTHITVKEPYYDGDTCDYTLLSIYGSYPRKKLVNLWLTHIGETPVNAEVDGVDQQITKLNMMLTQAHTNAKTYGESTTAMLSKHVGEMQQTANDYLKLIAK